MKEPAGMNIITNSHIQTYDQLEKLIIEEEKIILYFSSPACNVCLAVFPKLMDLLKDQLTKVLKIDINEHVEIAGQLLVFTVPTILIMYKGREVLRESRFIDFQSVERMLNSF
ncbi:thioredoxin family protein [Desulfosporosinus sp. OT]|uniref:thioredoxin family protein n=1 Tax=Desulfosporosinus sp. OT TaxID=913865 RepID=UPI0002239B82|nr:thioredoxin family protein [Desulfosporosinus sp. OT]EGW38741.1 cytochrome c heme-binding site [Desulfosporosinus sp. OT]